MSPTTSSDGEETVSAPPRPDGGAAVSTPPRPDGGTTLAAPPRPDGDTTLSAPPGPDAAADGRVPPSSNAFLARAAALTAALTATGALLGLIRDQSLAHLFGAGRDTDAFLVAWTVPEVASTLLIEDGMAFMLVPAFSAAIAARGRASAHRRDPVRALVSASLPRLTAAFLAASALLAVAAPYLVEALAPGLRDPRLAVTCTRMTAICVVTFGLAGYCGAALRAHGRYVAPAAIYLSYNAGIIVTLLTLADRWGVRAAAVGVAVGSVLMVLVQVPALRRLSTAAPAPVEDDAADEPGPEQSLNMRLIAAVLLFALCRQAQVFIERFLASSLPSGAISHLNYAQKVAQLPMMLSLMLCTVTFPVVAQALARGDVRGARDRVERDITLAVCIVLVGAAVVFACAPQIVELLFQRGAFTTRDSAATAGVMRVYCLGLLGHCLVGALVRSYFSTGRPTWYPVGCMAAGMALTAAAGAWAVGPWGVGGIAAANALGITFTASLLLSSVGSRGVPVRLSRTLRELGKTLLAAVGAAAAGLMCVSLVERPLAGLAVGCPAVGCVFCLLLWALDVQAFLPAVRTATRKLRNAC